MRMFCEDIIRYYIKKEGFYENSYCGRRKVGTALARQLAAEEDCDITLIDSDSNVLSSAIEPV